VTAPSAKRSDVTVHQAEPLNLEPPRRVLVDHALTPTDAFYVRCHGPVAELDPTAWRLTVDGLVERELELSLADLHARGDVREVVATLQCAGNRRADLEEVREIPGELPWGPAAAGTARWRGVPLAGVLADAGVGHGAAHVAFLGADLVEEGDPGQPFGASIPLAKARSPEVLLAWEMNDAPLAPSHGAPVRLLVPGYVGARSVKWLQRVTVTDRPSANFFQARSYRVFPPGDDPDRAPADHGVALHDLAVNSAILAPGDGERVRAGRLEVAGYAIVGGGRRVERVDVSVDGGASWTLAELLDDLGPWAWRRWRAEVDVPPGRREVVARAWDSAADQQPERAETVWNPKGYANNAWARVRVEAEA